MQNYMASWLVGPCVIALVNADFAPQRIVSGVDAEALVGHRWQRRWQADGTLAPPPPPPHCSGGACSSLVHYNVSGTKHYAEFNVPELPKNPSPTWFAYYNIDWQAAGPNGTDARMNQFVPQLMLGNPLDGSTGAPNYTPKWHPHKTWCFGAQYFFELFNKTSNSTHAHAATGTTFNCTPGEVIFTEFTLSKDWVWTLQMGVKGDKTRLSTVVAKQPFMGMISDETSSWKEDVYSKAWSNTCWELYGIKGPNDYPQSDMRYTIEISTDKPGSIHWSKWSTRQPTCPGHPTINISTSSTPRKQTIVWDINRTSERAAAMTK